MVFVIITKIIPPEKFLCNVAATALSLFAREHAKEFACVKRLFCNFCCKKLCQNNYFEKTLFVIILAAMVCAFVFPEEYLSYMRMLKPW